jgi:glutaminyl-tRNA synthetase
VVLVYLITRYAFPIKCTEVIYGDNPDEIVEIRAEYDPSKTSKPKVTRHLNLCKSEKSS